MIIVYKILNAAILENDLYYQIILIVEGKDNLP